MMGLATQMNSTLVYEKKKSGGGGALTKLQVEYNILCIKLF